MKMKLRKMFITSSASSSSLLWSGCFEQLSPHFECPAATEEWIKSDAFLSETMQFRVIVNAVDLGKVLRQIRHDLLRHWLVVYPVLERLMEKGDIPTILVWCIGFKNNLIQPTLHSWNESCLHWSKGVLFSLQKKEKLQAPGPPVSTHIFGLKDASQGQRLSAKRHTNKNSSIVPSWKEFFQLSNFIFFQKW